MKTQFAIAFVVAVLTTQLRAQTSTAATVAPAVTNAAVVAATNAEVAHTNYAIIPVPRTDKATNRQSLVLQRAKNNPGECDIAFIGDSITQGWENAGSNVWAQVCEGRKVLNFGVGGDRTEHVLWRFENGQLDGIKPKVVVLMIGTNNSNKNKKDGTEQYTEADILIGVQTIVQQIRERLPGSKLILVSIFPRGSTFSTQRGKILQVNQALARMDDGKNIFYVDFGSQLMEDDGSISKDMMRDYLHPGQRGYEIWAKAIEPKLKELLAN